MSEPRTDDWEKRVRLGSVARLRTSHDHGSGYLKVAVQYIYPGREETDDDVCDVTFGDHNCNDEVEVPQSLVWDHDSDTDDKHEHVIWGQRQVDRWLRKHPKRGKEVISNLKLALMEEFQDREVVKRTIKALGCKPDRASIAGSLQDIITDHFRQIRPAVIKWCRESHPANFGEHPPDWDNLPVELVLPVPSMWNPEANGIMANAAYNADYLNTNLREEPLCVAGSVMSRLCKLKQIRVSDRFPQRSMKVIELTCPSRKVIL